MISLFDFYPWIYMYARLNLESFKTRESNCPSNQEDSSLGESAQDKGTHVCLHTMWHPPNCMILNPVRKLQGALPIRPGVPRRFQCRSAGRFGKMRDPGSCRHLCSPVNITYFRFCVDIV